MKARLDELDNIISNLRGVSYPDVLQALHAKKAENAKVLAALKELRPIKTKVAIAMAEREKAVKSHPQQHAASFQCWLEAEHAQQQAAMQQAT